VTPEEKSSQEARGVAFRAIPNAPLAYVNNCWSGAEHTVLPVALISRGLPPHAQVPILDEKGVDIGVLLTVSGRIITDIASLPDVEYVAYVADAKPDELGHTYTFHKNYVAIKTIYLRDYLETYLAGAPLWGGFVHDHGPEHALVSPPLASSHKYLSAKSNVDYPTWHHVNTVLRSVLEPFAFERYLKIYHMLELVYDWDIVQDIRALNDDLYGIGQILSAYSRSESDILVRVIRDRCADFDRVAERLADIRHFPDEAKRIFYDYGKGGNPLKEHSDFEELFIKNAFSRLLHGKTKGLSAKVDFDAFCASLAAYWIYRIRCSVAHSRIGEYVMTQADELFMINFAESLIREVAAQAFRA
jgi:hypothetical protein